ncbi:class I SAM-dependent methyltransferase [Amycolatopsis japonica]|uniref:class I SAM-dependent methyltransferase n=1 Tax=Amycolatopsis japonica TaxID=208439 RepID=UPI00378ADEC2
MTDEQDWADTHARWGEDHTELYDLVFRSRGKNFETEADDITRLIQSRFPAAASLADVACGTGAHLARFANSFDHVEGVDIAPAMLGVASRRLPGVNLQLDDMRTFDLGRKFDSVVCLGNAIACLESRADMEVAVKNLASHLVPGGVLVVEPGWFPDMFIDGYVGGHLVRDNGKVVSRITHSVREGDHARVEIKFVVGESTGLREWTDYFLMNLFTQEEYVSAFDRADCSVELLDIPWTLGADPHNAPGLFVAVRK